MHKYQGDSDTSYIGNYLEVDHSTQLYPPTPTPSMTPTVTKTATATPKPTKTSIGGQENPTSANSATPSRTYTRTVTRTATATQTWTKTATRTLTRTPTKTLTPSKTPSNMPTWTPSITPRKTDAPTLTQTPIGFTPSATSSPTVTQTPTATSTGGVPVDQTWKFYYYAGSERVAMRVYVENQQNNVYYLFGDHLGSTSEVRNPDGTLYSRQWYKAFGEMRYQSSAMPTNRLYTGQLEIEFGLYHYGARIYDPVLGRFVQPDTLIPEAINPIEWDRYGYVDNNPMVYIDPSGHMITDGCNYESCSSEHADWYYHTTLVTAYSAAQPYPAVSYSQNVEETSCGGCSQEPYLPLDKQWVNGAAAIPLLLNDAAIMTGFILLDDTPEIFVALNYFEDPDGNLYVDNLQVNNNTGADLSLMQLSFTTSMACSDVCIGAPNLYYAVYTGETLTPPTGSYGIGQVAQSNSVTNINLVPSNNPVNMDNYFSNNVLVNVQGRLTSTFTNQSFPWFSTKYSLLHVVTK